MSSDSQESSSPSPPNFPNISELPSLDYTTELSDVVGPEIFKKIKRNKRCTVKIQYEGQAAWIKVNTESSQDNVENELAIYQYLHERKCEMIPKLMALIKKDDKIIGFITRDLNGRDPIKDHPGDIKICKAGLKKLHQYGVAHGDVTRMNNIMIVGEDAKFFDFEASITKEGSQTKELPKDNFWSFDSCCKEDLLSVERRR